MRVSMSVRVAGFGFASIGRCHLDLFDHERLACLNAGKVAFVQEPAGEFVCFRAEFLDAPSGFVVKLVGEGDADRDERGVLTDQANADALGRWNAWVAGFLYQLAELV